ncbi:MAG: hypothetical protein IJN65_06230 [Clostridia bacterium]|nr:hypothetical protein [Clostridia bacterium]
MINNQIIDYKDYGKCLKISNGVIDAVVTLDVGPRIIYFGFVNGDNIMNNQKQRFEPVKGEGFDKHYYKGAMWQNFGGHRLWTSPEHSPTTYYPDCEPVEYEITKNGAIFTPKPQRENGIAMQIEIIMSEDGADMTVLHKIKNISAQPKKFSLWALSVAAEDGIEIIPTNTKNTGLLPNRLMVIWPYTDMLDERIFIGNKYVTIHQKDVKKNIKLGFALDEGKAYYVKNNTVFCVKYDTFHNTKDYPDFGVSFETYSNDFFTEIETLSELKDVAPGATATHDEYWSLYKKPCELDERNEESIEQFINSLK